MGGCATPALYTDFRAGRPIGTIDPSQEPTASIQQALAAGRIERADTRSSVLSADGFTAGDVERLVIFLGPAGGPTVPRVASAVAVVLRPATFSVDLDLSGRAQQLGFTIKPEPCCLLLKDFASALHETQFPDYFVASGRGEFRGVVHVRDPGAFWGQNGAWRITELHSTIKAHRAAGRSEEASDLQKRCARFPEVTRHFAELDEADEQKWGEPVARIERLPRASPAERTSAIFQAAQLLRAASAAGATSDAPRELLERMMKEWAARITADAEQAKRNGRALEAEILAAVVRATWAPHHGFGFDDEDSLESFRRRVNACTQALDLVDWLRGHPGSSVGDITELLARAATAPGVDPMAAAQRSLVKELRVRLEPVATDAQRRGASLEAELIGMLRDQLGETYPDLTAAQQLAALVRALTAARNLEERLLVASAHAQDLPVIMPGFLRRARARLREAVIAEAQGEFETAKREGRFATATALAIARDGLRHGSRSLEATRAEADFTESPRPDANPAGEFLLRVAPVLEAADDADSRAIVRQLTERYDVLRDSPVYRLTRLTLATSASARAALRARGLPTLRVVLGEVSAEKLASTERSEQATHTEVSYALQARTNDAARDWTTRNAQLERELLAVRDQLQVLHERPPVAEYESYELQGAVHTRDDVRRGVGSSTVVTKQRRETGRSLGRRAGYDATVHELQEREAALLEQFRSLGAPPPATQAELSRSERRQGYVKEWKLVSVRYERPLRLVGSLGPVDERLVGEGSAALLRVRPPEGVGVSAVDEWTNSAAQHRGLEEAKKTARQRLDHATSAVLEGALRDELAARLEAYLRWVSKQPWDEARRALEGRAARYLVYGLEPEVGLWVEAGVAAPDGKVLLERLRTIQLRASPGP